MNKIRFLTERELRSIIDKMGVAKREKTQRDRAIFETLFSTGLRVHELVALPDAPFADCKSDTLELSIMGKGSHQRVIFFSPACLKAIKGYLSMRRDDDSLLLFNLTIRAVQYIVKARGEAAGFKDLHPHVVRHSFATDLLNKGVDVRVVQEFMGHKSITSTMIYTHVTNMQLKNIHTKLYK